jgi:hypothetical protein
MSKQLLTALLNDSKLNPERGNATFERVAEIIEAIMGEVKAKNVVETLEAHCLGKGCRIKDRRDELNPRQGRAVAAKVLQLTKSGTLSSNKLSQLVEMLNDSERFHHLEQSTCTECTRYTYLN